jgi:hypothetical protein
MSNQRILTLYPYLYPGTTCWVFDDARTGLKEEAFVEGTSEMITRVVERKNIPRAAKGFLLSFSDQPFDGPRRRTALASRGCPGRQLVRGRRPRLTFGFAITATPRCNRSTERPPMRRADPSVLTPREREEWERMLHTLVLVKEAIQSFEDGETNLRDTVCEMATVLSAVRGA